MPGDFRLVAAGDSVLILEFEERIDPEINARAIALARDIERRRFAGLRDVVPTYRSVAIFFDPLRTDLDRLVPEIKALASPSAGAVHAGAPVDVPVCYGGELGPDLADVARFAGCSEERVMEIHVATVYRVYMLGFVPGFAYMGSVDPQIRMPRHSTPRMRVPIGSVGIAGFQTGVYPMETPGGWRLIGRTPLRPFDANREHPFLFQAGDSVRFTPISREIFASLASSPR